MQRTELLNLFTRQQRIEIDYPDIQKEVDGTVIRHINSAGEGGIVIYSRLDEYSVEDAISAQIARFDGLSQGFEWKVFDYDPPADLVERLRRRGFEIGEPEALLVLDLTSDPAVLTRPASAPVKRITDPGDIDAVIALENTIWRTDHHSLGERLKKDMVEYPEMVSVYLSYEGEQPVSAGWIYFHPGTRFASLWGGSTLPQYRHRGHYTSLLTIRAQEAFAKGFPLLYVDASPMSRPVLEKHGFQFLATSTPCTWTIHKPH